MTDQQLGTVVIGGSQAGLAVGYHLRQQGLPFVILDDHERIGDAWRTRWDSLHLFTPGRYNNLPGMPFPGPPASYPSKDEIADYLEAYVRRFDLPVRTAVKVDRLSKVGERFEVMCGKDTLLAENVVVATGASSNPRIPTFARELDQRIVQLHSKEYPAPLRSRKGDCWWLALGTPARRSPSSSRRITRRGYRAPTRGRSPPGGPGVCSIECSHLSCGSWRRGC